MTIKNIEGLRDHAINTLLKLDKGKIDTSQAGVTGKLCESVVSTIKAELEYCKMLDVEPNIPFLECKKTLSNQKAIPQKKTKDKKK